MQIDTEIVKQVAANARLKLKEEEIKKLTIELNEILSAFQTLSEADTANTKPSFHPIEIKNIAREDVPEESVKQEEALSLSQHTKNGYFKGPKIL